MRLFIYKLLIALVLFYVFFELTIGAKISKIENAVYQLKDSHARDEVKDKILSEMKKANEKDKILKEDEKIIISNFINKIMSELELNSKK